MTIKLPFLDVCVKHELDGTLSTSVYRKPTYSGLLMKYDSFVPIELYAVLFMAWLTGLGESVHLRQTFKEICILKCLFSANGYLERFVVKCVKTVINRKGLDVVSPVYSTGAIVKNLASNVNLSHYMDLWTLGSKLQENNCWTFFQ